MIIDSKLTFALAAAMFLVGCSTTTHKTPATTPEALNAPVSATMPADAAQPFFVHEARLPADFPPAGPIGTVIVKSYPPCRVATVLAADVKGQGQDRLFMPLFDHIQKEKIAMTSPLVMDFSVTDSAAADPPQPPIAMSLIYSSQNVGELEKAGVVTVHDLPAISVLSVGVRGSYDGEHFEAGMKLIARWLAAYPNSYKIAGPPRFLGYNSPFVPWFLRYGEVQVPVKIRRAE